MRSASRGEKKADAALTAGRRNGSERAGEDNARQASADAQQGKAIGLARVRATQRVIRRRHKSPSDPRAGARWTITWPDFRS